MSSTFDHKIKAEVKIRHDTFHKCTKRYSDEYIYPEDYTIEFGEVPILPNYANNKISI